MKDTYLKDGYFTSVPRNQKGKGLNLNDLIRTELRENGYPIKNCPDPCGEPNLCDLINCGGSGGNGLFDSANENGTVDILQYFLNDDLTLQAATNNWSLLSTNRFRVTTSSVNVSNASLNITDSTQFFIAQASYPDSRGAALLLTKDEAILRLTGNTQNHYYLADYLSGYTEISVQSLMSTAKLTLAPNSVSTLQAGSAGELLIATKDVTNFSVLDKSILQYSSPGISEYTPYPFPSVAAPNDGQPYFPAVTNTSGTQVASWQRSLALVTGVGGQTVVPGVNVDNFTLTSPRYSVVDKVVFYTAQLTLTTEVSASPGEDVQVDFTQAALGALGTPTNLESHITVTRGATLVAPTIIQLSPTSIRVIVQTTGPSDTLVYRIRLTSHFL